MPRGHAGEPRTPGSGRQKGTPNHVTSELKDMILGALTDAGGQKYLLDQASKNPNAFLTLIGKYIPAELHQKLSGQVKVNGTVNFIKPSARD